VDTNPLPRGTKLWLAAHAVGIATWLYVASPLWRHALVGGCYDAGDSFYMLAYPIPLLGLGAGAAVFGWVVVAMRRRQPHRNARLLAWSIVVAAWIGAVVVAIALIRLEGAPPC
jgi:hypothetical protein